MTVGKSQIFCEEVSVSVTLSVPKHVQSSLQSYLTGEPGEVTKCTGRTVGVSETSVLSPSASALAEPSPVSRPVVSPPLHDPGDALLLLMTVESSVGLADGGMSTPESWKVW